MNEVKQLIFHVYPFNIAIGGKKFNRWSYVENETADFPCFVLNIAIGGNFFHAIGVICGKFST